MDLFHTVEFIDFQEYDDLSRFHPTLTKAMASSQLHVIEPDGEIHGGFLAFRRMCLLFPMLYVLIPVVYFPSMGVVGPVFYRWIAENRYCLGGACSKE